MVCLLSSIHTKQWIILFITIYIEVGSGDDYTYFLDAKWLVENGDAQNTVMEKSSHRNVGGYIHVHFIIIYWPWHRPISLPGRNENGEGWRDANCVLTAPGSIIIHPLSVSEDQGATGTGLISHHLSHHCSPYWRHSQSWSGSGFPCSVNFHNDTLICHCSIVPSGHSIERQPREWYL